MGWGRAWRLGEEETGRLGDWECLEALVVVRVSADEEPQDGAVFFDPESAVVVINTHGPEGAYTLKMEGGVPVIFQPELELLPGACLNGRRQEVVELPEIRRD